MSGRSTWTAWGRFLVAAGTSVLVASCGGETEPESQNPQQVLEQLNATQQRHDPVKFVEVDLGQFMVTHRPTAKGHTLLVNFHIFGVLPETGQDDFNAALETRQKRMRDGVISTILRTDADHLRAANLGWVKSELIVAINRRLKTDLLRDVVFTEYSLEKP